MKNTFLVPFTLPPFSTLRYEHIIDALKYTIDCSRKKIEQIINSSNLFTWSNLCQEIANIENKINIIWATVNHLNAVQNNTKLRKIYELSIPIITEYSIWVEHNKKIYDAYHNLKHGKFYSNFNKIQKTAINNILRDFELSGINLPKDKKLKYKKIISKLLKLESTYSNNVLDATIGWNKLIIDKNIINGLPKNALDIASINAKLNKKTGWLLTLNDFSYKSIITYCDNINLRKEIYYAYNTRASDIGPNANKWDNGPIINKILTLRYKLAQLLGFNSFADKSIITKVAESPQHVLNFLNKLIKYVHAQGKEEWEQLKNFTIKYYRKNVINIWDIAYFSEKQKQYMFCINDEQLRPYFPEKKVINGLFEIVERIYGITIKENINVETWDPSVRFFELFNEKKEQLGGFYFDLYVRNNKRSGAWMDVCMDMLRKMDGTLQKPIAYLNCNFAPPDNNKVSLLTHNEVIILFHEFGHVLHHVLTKIDIPWISGIKGIPWDVVELPSQLMENYCWQTESLKLISGHYITGEPLPEKLLDNLLKMKNYQSALFILRQIELSLFDFQLHYKYNPEKKQCVLETLIKIKKQVTEFLPNVKWMRFPNFFNHIFSSSSYAAGYYSYLWADLLAADAWSLFQEKGIFNKTIGKLFLENILSLGGSESPITLFTRFRGREPQIDAMLKKYEIKK